MTIRKMPLPQPLFEEIRQGIKKIDGVVISHAHLDHYGLARMLPRNIPLYCGAASAELIEITAKVRSFHSEGVAFQYFRGKEPFTIGPFSITPYLMDHSVPDSYAFQVSASFLGVGRACEDPAAGEFAQLDSPAPGQVRLAQRRSARSRPDRPRRQPAHARRAGRARGRSAPRPRGSVDRRSGSRLNLRAGGDRRGAAGFRLSTCVLVIRIC